MLLFPWCFRSKLLCYEKWYSKLTRGVLDLEFDSSIPALFDKS